MLYYEMEGRRQGPFTPDEIVDLVSRGSLSPTTNVFDADGRPQPAADVSRSNAPRGDVPPPPPLPLPPPFPPAPPLAAHRTTEILRDLRQGVGELTWRAKARLSTTEPEGSAFRRVPTLTTDGKRNMLIAFIITPFLLPSFGSPLGGTGTALVALVASLVGCAVYFLFCEPERRSVAPALGAFFFTAIAGVVFLLVFQETARLAASTPRGSGGGVGRIVWLILSVVGQSYSRTLGHDPVAENLSFFGTVLASITSVGLCEEITKLLPVIFVLRKGIVRTLQGTLFVAALSGLGFGISEGVIYSVTLYQPARLPLTVYLLRFFGVAFGHAALVLLSTSVLFYWRNTFFDACKEATASEELGVLGWFLILFYLVLIALASAIPHGLYDAFLLHRWDGLAGLTFGIVIWSAVAIQRAGAKQTVVTD